MKFSEVRASDDGGGPGGPGPPLFSKFAFMEFIHLLK